MDKKCIEHLKSIVNAAYIDAIDKPDIDSDDFKRGISKLRKNIFEMIATYSDTTNDENMNIENKKNKHKHKNKDNKKFLEREDKQWHPIDRFEKINTDPTITDKNKTTMTSDTHSIKELIRDSKNQLKSILRNGEY